MWSVSVCLSSFFWNPSSFSFCTSFIFSATVGLIFPPVRLGIIYFFYSFSGCTRNYYMQTWLISLVLKYFYSVTVQSKDFRTQPPFFPSQLMLSLLCMLIINVRTVLLIALCSQYLFRFTCILNMILFSVPFCIFEPPSGTVFFLPKKHLLKFPLVEVCWWHTLSFCPKMYILAGYQILGWHLFPFNTIKIFPCLLNSTDEKSAVSLLLLLRWFVVFFPLVSFSLPLVLCSNVSRCELLFIFLFGTSWAS